jgi:hypothetical protein
MDTRPFAYAQGVWRSNRSRLTASDSRGWHRIRIAYGTDCAEPAPAIPEPSKDLAMRDQTAEFSGHVL